MPRSAGSAVSGTAPHVLKVFMDNSTESYQSFRITASTSAGEVRDMIVAKGNLPRTTAMKCSIFAIMKKIGGRYGSCAVKQLTDSDKPLALMTRATGEVLFRFKDSTTPLDFDGDEFDAVRSLTLVEKAAFAAAAAKSSASARRGSRSALTGGPPPGVPRFLWWPRAASIGGPRMCGFLLKRSHRVRNLWKRRWFCLHNNVLWYSRVQPLSPARIAAAKSSAVAEEAAAKLRSPKASPATTPTAGRSRSGSAMGAAGEGGVSSRYSDAKHISLVGVQDVQVSESRHNFGCFEFSTPRRPYHLRVVPGADKRMREQWVAALRSAASIAQENDHIATADMIASDCESRAASADRRVVDDLVASFDSFLHNKAARALLKEHMTAENNFEQLTFVTAAQSYAKECAALRVRSESIDAIEAAAAKLNIDPPRTAEHPPLAAEDLWRMAQQIYVTFCLPGAPKELSMRSVQRAGIFETLEAHNQRQAKSAVAEAEDCLTPSTRCVEPPPADLYLELEQEVKRTSTSLSFLARAFRDRSARCIPRCFVCIRPPPPLARALPRCTALSPPRPLLSSLALSLAPARSLFLLCVHD
jgi:hypothetical protein